MVQYLEEDGFIERLQATIDETYLDDPDTAAQASEFFTLLGDLLAQVIRVLGDQVLSPGDFASLLSSGVAAEEIGLLPSQNDAINAGAILRSKMDEIKALFGGAVGRQSTGRHCRNGIVIAQRPRPVGGKRALDGQQRGRARQRGGVGGIQRILQAKPLAVPFLSTSRLQPANSSCPRPISSRFLSCFPAPYAGPRKGRRRFTPPKATLLPLAEAVRRVQDGETVDPVWAAAYCALEQMHYPQVAQALKGLSPREDEIGPALAHALYADEKGAYTTPITGLETLARCPFRHFMERGLHLAPADEFGKRRLMRATIIMPCCSIFCCCIATAP